MLTVFYKTKWKHPQAYPLHGSRAKSTLLAIEQPQLGSLGVRAWAGGSGWMAVFVLPIPRICTLRAD